MSGPDQAVQAAAPFLFSDDIIQKLTDAESKGEYTSERLKSQRPHVYQAIIELRGLSWGQKRIAEFLKVHHRTVAAVDDAEPEAIDTVRQRLIRKLRRGATLLVDRIVEEPSIVPPQSIGLTVGQFLDKAELLDGRANVRVEHVERIDIYADWDQFVEKQLEPGTGVIEIGLSGEKKPPIDGGASAAIEDRAGRELGGTDEQSVDCQAVEAECYDNRSDLDSKVEPITAPQSSGVESRSGAQRDPPGGGSGLQQQPKSKTDNGAAQNFGNRPPQP